MVRSPHCNLRRSRRYANDERVGVCHKINPGMRIADLGLGIDLSCQSNDREIMPTLFSSPPQKSHTVSLICAIPD
ncbi:hypothetical protein [Moorena producens]|uniref:hypothetical protein n=1 Tax=Moorena producens TaxID=1155739 RepID=UPI003C73B2EA